MSRLWTPVSCLGERLRKLATPIYDWRDRLLGVLFAAGEPTPAWKQVLLLCVPALLIGLALRVALMAAIPEGYYGSDSNSYFAFARDWWLDGDLKLEEKRRFLYPIFLALVAKLPGGAASWVPLLQHVAGLGSVVAAGWVTAHVTRFHRIWVPVVTTLVAVWPRTLWHEHEVIAEALLLSSMVWATACAFPLSTFGSGNRLRLVFGFGAVMVGLKPQSKVAWVAMVGLAMLLGPPVWRWRWSTWLPLLVGAFFAFSSGKKTHVGYLFLSSVLPMVNPQPQDNWLDPYREELRPLIIEACDYGDHFPAAQRFYKKRLVEGNLKELGPHWTALVDRKTTGQPSLARAYSGFTREALLNDPMRFVQFTFSKILIAAGGAIHSERLDPPSFWKDQEDRNADRWPTRPREMCLYYAMADQGEYNQRVRECETRRFVALPLMRRVGAAFRWAQREMLGPQMEWARPNAMTWLVLAGAVAMFSATWRMPAGAFLLTPLLLYLTSVYAVGDCVARYLYPVEWLGVLMVCAVPDALLERIVQLRVRTRQRVPVPL